MSAARPGNAADTAWQHCHRLALWTPVHPPDRSLAGRSSFAGWPRFGHHRQLDAVAQARDIANQRLE
jgi:hypothetical protein